VALADQDIAAGGDRVGQDTRACPEKPSGLTSGGAIAWARREGKGVVSWVAAPVAKAPRPVRIAADRPR